MEQKLFYRCNLFNDGAFKVSPEFTVTQNEISLSKMMRNYKATFKKREVEYNCKWTKQDNWDSKKPTLLIPIRDNKNLIDYTIANLKETNLIKHCNIIIIDDRSIEDIRSSAEENSLSYLRVDNEKGFNFSMLNNIAAKICYELGNETIILWNSDLWCVKEEWFVSLLERHKQSGAWISGSKLVYPPKEKSLNKEENTNNIKDNFENMAGAWRNTIQFGGSSWVETQSSSGTVSLNPIHHRRFAAADDLLSNCDKPTSHVTGALHIWNLEKFISLGGLNPSLSRNFQDIDICLKALQAGSAPMYLGKDIYFYHDESYNFYSNRNETKYDLQTRSDNVLFNKIWNEALPSLII